MQDRMPTHNPLDGERIDEMGRGNRVYGNGLQQSEETQAVIMQSRKNDPLHMRIGL